MKVRFAQSPDAIPAVGVSSAFSTVEQEPSGDVLTAREFEVARLIGLGLTLHQIAHALAVSIDTVKTHRRHLAEKTGATDRMTLMAALGWLKVPDSMSR